VNGSFLGRAGEPRDDEMVESVDPKSGAVAFGIVPAAGRRRGSHPDPPLLSFTLLLVVTPAGLPAAE